MANFYGQYVGFGAGTTVTGPTFGGSTRGYAASGANPYNNIINRISFTSDTNAVDVGDLLETRQTAAGTTHIENHGYWHGGYSTTDLIERMSFSAEGNTTDVGNLTSARRECGGNSSETHGFCHSGYNNNEIERYAYASSADAVDVGDATQATVAAGGCTDLTNAYGYISGGWATGASDVIERYAFASSAAGADVGDLAIAGGTTGNASSATHGYDFGQGQSPVTNIIQKFAFAATSADSDIANMTVDRYGATGVSSTSHGYSCGGDDTGGGGSALNVIDKFAMASDSDATDVGDLSQAAGFMGPTGTQY